MKHSFVIRLYNSNTGSQNDDITELTISGITLLSKPSKFEICYHKGNQNKFNYKMEIVGKLNKVSGSNNYPNLSSKNNYVDIVVTDFPRYPAFYQDQIAARNCKNGWEYTNHLNDGFPIYLLNRKVNILNSY